MSPVDLPFVSVVVPTRDRPDLLVDCLASLTRQHYPADRYEIIVVDDGALDATRSAALDANCGYARNRGSGLNAGRNTGLAVSIGDPVCFVDDDVDAPEGWLPAMVNGSLRHPHADCFGGPIRLRLEGTGPRVCGREALGESELDHGPRDCDAVVYGANFAVRRRAVEMAGEFDEAIPSSGDEEEWQFRLRRAGGRVVYVADACVWHRRSSDNLRLGAMMRKRLRRGVDEVVYRRRVDDPVRVKQEVRSSARALGHAARRRCSWGLLSASTSIGRIIGVLRGPR